MRTIAIGDIHGCSLALKTLLKQLQLRSTDTIVTLGDYVNRGPDVRGVIESLLEVGAHSNLVALRGNHEAVLLSVLDEGSDVTNFMAMHGDTTLQSYQISSVRDLPGEHVRFLRGTRLHFETQSHLFVHAGYEPDRPLAASSSYVLLWQPLDAATLRPHASGKTAILGHTPRRNGEILDAGHVVAIDTGCVYGQWLTALDANEGHWWQADQLGRIRQGRLAERGT